MNEPVVHVIDDDTSVRESLKWLIESVGLGVRTWPDAAEFLASFAPAGPGCILLDIRMPGVNGMEVLERLRRQGITTPVIIITGHADVPMAIRAMKLGAHDFLEKPYNDQLLLERIQRAVEHDRGRQREREVLDAIRLRAATLSVREREVLDCVVAGQSNKQIARELDLSIKTVEVHRANMMSKMRADSLSDLIRMAVRAGLEATPDG